VTSWSEYSQCDTSQSTFKDVGVATRTRTVLYEPVNAGAHCPELKQEKVCWESVPVNSPMAASTNKDSDETILGIPVSGYNTTVSVVLLLKSLPRSLVMLHVNL
jgi:hypothetical protein